MYDYRNKTDGSLALRGDGRDGMSDEDETKGRKIRTEAEIRAERLARTLRDNLQRRKQQARARRAGEADETTGLPAAKKDESDG